jgi:hypothetical protein
MRHFNFVLRMGLAAALAPLTGQAVATTTTFLVNAAVVSTCAVSTTKLSFGNYDALAAARNALPRPSALARRRGRARGRGGSGRRGDGRGTPRVPAGSGAPPQAARRFPAPCRAAVLVVAAILIPSAYARIAAGHEIGVTEYQVKAAFLYNFAKFVDWPAEAFGAESAAFTLCVLGDEAFASAHESLAGKTVKGRPMAVRRVASATDAGECHMLFVGAADGDEVAPVLAAIGRHTLTVGETRDFTRHGGVINLTRIDNEIRFEIDRVAGERAGFRFSSQLLKLAIPVDHH